MPRFTYVAVGADGQRFTSTQDAPDPEALAASLRGNGLVPVSIGSAGVASGAAATARKRKRGRIKLIDALIYTHWALFSSSC